MKARAIFHLWLGAALLAGGPGSAAGDSARIAIIIDDLGNQRAAGLRVTQLPAPVSCAVLPHTPHGAAIARAAHAAGKDVLLHLPMESLDAHDPGPGGLTADMPEHRLLAVLASDLASVPHVRGVNNHMGSLLTTQALPMHRVMRALRDRGGLFFVDSRTHSASLAAQAATLHGVASVSRDVFLDNDPDVDAIERQFEVLLAQARRHGQAVGIGHPYPETLEVLERWLPVLGLYRIRVVPVSELVEPPGPLLARARADHSLRLFSQPRFEDRLWQTYLSP